MDHRTATAFALEGGLPRCGHREGGIAVLRAPNGLMKLTFTSWPSGNTFALAEELRSLGLEGVHFEGSYDTETRNGALIFEVPS